MVVLYLLGTHSSFLMMMVEVVEEEEEEDLVFWVFWALVLLRLEPLDLVSWHLPQLVLEVPVSLPSLSTTWR